jgi:hypothetical protein
VGFVEVITLPLSSTATHRAVLGQDTAFKPLEPSTWVTLQAAAPAPGLVEVTTLPARSTATQRALLGHDTPLKKQGEYGSDCPLPQPEPSTCVTLQAPAPPNGLVEVTTLPLLSTATQSPALRQDTPDREVPPGDG